MSGEASVLTCLLLWVVSGVVRGVSHTLPSAAVATLEKEAPLLLSFYVQ